MDTKEGAHTVPLIFYGHRRHHIIYQSNILWNRNAGEWGIVESIIGQFGNGKSREVEGSPIRHLLAQHHEVGRIQCSVQLQLGLCSIFAIFFCQHLFLSSFFRSKVGGNFSISTACVNMIDSSTSREFTSCSVTVACLFRLVAFLVIVKVNASLRTAARDSA